MNAGFQRSITLVLEGNGDLTAVPLLARRVLEDRQIYDVTIAPRPTMAGDYFKLARIGELERHLIYANSKPGIGALICIDCDDGCPLERVREFTQRAINLGDLITKKVAFSLFRREFETLFLCSITSIAEAVPDIQWKLDDLDDGRDFEEGPRDAKGFLNKLMGQRFYRETRDQTKFTQHLDLDALRLRSRAYRHFESSIDWLVTVENTDNLIYPIFNNY